MKGLRKFGLYAHVGPPTAPQPYVSREAATVQFETESPGLKSNITMAVQELDRLFSRVIDTQITLALSVLNSTATAESDIQQTQAKHIAVLACNAAERFASRLPIPESKSYWNGRLLDLRLALSQVRQ
jgi:hypothetical protein